MKKYILFLFIVIFALSWNSQDAQAVSKCGLGGDAMVDHCGIWLCAAGGFPNGCGPQESKFYQRSAKNDCAPIPSYPSCFGSNGGSYEMGVDYFYPCEQEGYELQISYDDSHNAYTGAGIRGYCVYESNSCNNGEGGYWGSQLPDCSYKAQKRPKHRFIQLQIKGKTYPKFWY